MKISVRILEPPAGRPAAHRRRAGNPARRHPLVGSAAAPPRAFMQGSSRPGISAACNQQTEKQRHEDRDILRPPAPPPGASRSPPRRRGRPPRPGRPPRAPPARGLRSRHRGRPLGPAKNLRQIPARAGIFVWGDHFGPTSRRRVGRATDSRIAARNATGPPPAPRPHAAQPPGFRSGVKPGRPGATRGAGAVARRPELRGVWPAQMKTAPAGAGSGRWWSQTESNRRPLECHSSALPTELWPHILLGCAPAETRRSAVSSIQALSREQGRISPYLSSLPPTSKSRFSSSSSSSRNTSASSSPMSSTSSTSSTSGISSSALGLLGVGVLERNHLGFVGAATSSTSCFLVLLFLASGARLAGAVTCSK